MQDTYYQRSEVSNSDLTELKNLLYPRTQYGDKEKAFKFGSLVDAMLTEPERVRYDKHTVDDVLYSGEDWELAQAMIKSLRMEARRDPLIKYALEQSDKQKFMVNKIKNSNTAILNTHLTLVANGISGFQQWGLEEI